MRSRAAGARWAPGRATCVAAGASVTEDGGRMRHAFHRGIELRHPAWILQSIGNE